MDIEGLKAELRRFAAERGWERFHTPKNLATALMVEAAELAEIFQWMTPEESMTAHHDPATSRHVGEEVADVLLYLLQVADRTGIDVRRAVADKLKWNGQKDPPSQKAEADRPGDAAPRVTYVLLDYENVQPTDSELRALVPEATRVWVFHGPQQREVAQKFSSFGQGVVPVPISKPGKNALDFHLSFYMGYIASRHGEASIVVVANDKGYGPVLEHAKAMGFNVRQHGHAKRGAPKAVALPDGAPTAKQVKAAAKKIPSKPAAAKKTVAKTGKAPAKKTVAKKAVVKKAAGSKETPAARSASSATSSGKVTATSSGAPDIDAVLARMIESLRKMGDKRPSKSASLKRAMKPLLGASSTEDAIALALEKLVAHGAVALEPRGEASYPLFA